MKREKKKESSKGLIVIAAIILACLSIPVGIISYTSYFAWDAQQSGELYKPAFETGGKLYELKMQGSTLAFDEGEAENHLYINSPYSVGEFIALAYGDFKIDKTENPYFAGALSFGGNKYLQDETKYRSPTEKYYVYTYFDQNRTPIFTYEPETESEFVQKLRPTFPAFSKRKYSIGNKRDFIDVTKLLKTKLGKNLRVRADEANKLLVFTLE